MKHLKMYEYYYDENGKIYSDFDFEHLPDAFLNDKIKYINDSLEKHIPELTKITNRLIEINNDLENVGPLDEEIQDAIDALNTVLEKWENRPVNKKMKKYNL